MPTGCEGERAAEPRLRGRDLLLLYGGFAAGVTAATWPLVLAPGSSWPPHHDPRLFTWVMASQARRLLSAPLELFHGNALYPYGESLAFSEPLLVPSVLGLPGFVWGNPVLTYNLLLLALWPLDGVAMAWAAHRVTGSRPAAWLAGVVFCLSPYFTEYHLEFQMLLAAPVPVVLLAWVRWLETGSRRWLTVALGGLVLQGLTTWYYTIILGIALVGLGLGFLCLRWRDWAWGRRLGHLGVGGIAVGLVLLPVAWPYVIVHRELGFERGVGETAAHSADLFTFIEPGDRSLLYRFAPAQHVAETSTFLGFTVLALAIASVAWLRVGERPAASRLRRLVAGGLALSLAGAVALMLRPLPRWKLAGLVIHPRAAGLIDLAVVLAFALLLARGWAAYRAGAPRRLPFDDWVRLLALSSGIAAILALGPVIHVGTREIGPGPYLAFYHVLLPLHAVRITTRFAVVVAACVGLLAALGVRWLEERLRARPAVRRLVVAAVFVAVGLEYAVQPVDYEPVDWRGRPVDRALRADRAEAAVLEFPTNVDDSDGDAMFRSLVHDKYVVNGISGFVPASLRDLSGLLTTAGSPFPVPRAQEALRQIYPLRYLVVRLGDPALGAEWRPAWLALRTQAPPLLRFRGSFGDEDLYEVVPEPEQGWRIARLVSYEFLRRHPALRATLRPLVSGRDVRQWVEVAVDDRVLERVALDGETRAAVRLTPPYRQAEANRITLTYGYARPLAAGDPRYRVGATGARSPGDLRVESRGQPFGSHGSIRLNGVELSPDRRGYNLVAVAPDGQVRGRGRFDTFGDPQASARLAAWVAALPPRTVVAGAVRDEASAQLGDEAVRALQTLGVAGDLRDRFREAHAFVGAVGAAPGTALEALGARPVSLAVGRDDEGLGLELDAFALEPPAVGR